MRRNSFGVETRKTMMLYRVFSESNHSSSKLKRNFAPLREMISGLSPVGLSDIPVESADRLRFPL
jgi:hypothetical protein